MQILCRNQARVGRIPGRIERTLGTLPVWRETRSLAAVTHKKARYPHEVDTGLKARLCS